MTQAWPQPGWPGSLTIPPTVSVQDAASYLGVDVATVQQMAAANRLVGNWNAGGLSSINGASLHEVLAAWPIQGSVPGDIESGA